MYLIKKLLIATYRIGMGIGFLGIFFIPLVLIVLEEDKINYIIQHYITPFAYLVLFHQAGIVALKSDEGLNRKLSELAYKRFSERVRNKKELIRE